MKRKVIVASIIIVFVAALAVSFTLLFNARELNLHTDSTEELGFSVSWEIRGLKYPLGKEGIICEVYSEQPVYYEISTQFATKDETFGISMVTGNNKLLSMEETFWSNEKGAETCSIHIKVSLSESQVFETDYIYMF